MAEKEATGHGGLAYADGPGIGWSNVLDILLEDGDCTDAVLPNPGSTSKRITIDALGFSVPSTAAITGIKVEYKKQRGASNGPRDNLVMLRKAGVLEGDNKANAEDWETDLTWVTYGGPGELWGYAWTPADINHADFGVAIKVISNAGAGPVAAYIDVGRVTIYYTSLDVARTCVGRANLGARHNYGSPVGR